MDLEQVFGLWASTSSPCNFTGSLKKYKENTYGNYLAHKGHSTSTGVLYSFLPPSSSPLLFTLMGPIIYGNAHTVNHLMVSPDSNLPSPLGLAWVWFPSPSLAPLEPYTRDPWKQLFQFSIGFGCQIGNTEMENCGHCGKWWLTHLFLFQFFP